MRNGPMTLTVSASASGSGSDFRASGSGSGSAELGTTVSAGGDHQHRRRGVERCASQPQVRRHAAGRQRQPRGRASMPAAAAAGRDRSGPHRPGAGSMARRPNSAGRAAAVEASAGRIELVAAWPVRSGRELRAGKSRRGWRSAGRVEARRARPQHGRLAAAGAVPAPQRPARCRRRGAQAQASAPTADRRGGTAARPAAIARSSRPGSAGVAGEADQVAVQRRASASRVL